MTLKAYLWGIRISAFLSLIAWGMVVWYIDPNKSGLAGMILFYGSAFLFLSSIFILFLAWISRISSAEDSPIRLSISFRQGILLSLMTLTLMFFQQFKILLWWDGLLVVVAFLLLELHFLTRK